MTSPADNILPFSVKPTASIVFVTPEMAQRWLDEKNNRNRIIRERSVATYVRDMVAGKWQFNGEAIKFSPSDTLLDGQHRLTAIVRSGMTVPMYVIRGITEDAQSTMDSGRKRTAADALAIRKEPNSVLLAATARLAIGIESGQENWDRYEATHAEVAEWIDAHPNIRDAVDVARQFARRCDCPPAVVAYTAWRFLAIDQADAVAFWSAAADKVGLVPGDPTIALTHRFAESRRNREHLTKRIYISAIFRAWNARRKGTSLKTIRINSPAGGLIPVPEPK